MGNDPGTLYVVATPIGNLDDLSPRAQRLLAEAGMVAAEDTRHTSVLLNHFGIHKPLISLHEHNENKKIASLVEKLLQGVSIALVSDAGTPLISDPGFNLVRAARDAGIRVIPVPGACALIAALSASGLPTDRFVFEGFLPAKYTARRKRLAELATETRTLVFYESVHRLAQSLADMAVAIGAARQAVVARELTKLHEELRAGSLEELACWAKTAPEARMGEVVILLRGAPTAAQTWQADAVLRPLLELMPVRQAAEIAARITGLSKNELYQRALQLAGRR